MFDFKSCRAELTTIAAMILEYGTQDELDAIVKRLRDHISGVKPIDAETWLQRELYEEQQN